MVCREDLPEVKTASEQCTSIRDSLLGQEQQALDDFNLLNVFESPSECNPLQADPSLYFTRMKEHFRGKAVAFWESYHRLGNISQNITQWVCSTKTSQYYQKIAECKTKQLELEQTACDIYERTNESCHLLDQCYLDGWNFYVGTVARVKISIENLKFEYRMIKRIECLLDAFAAADMDAAIDICIQKTHSDAAVNSPHADAFSPSQKPIYVTPTVCTSGVEGFMGVLHPNDRQFPAVEYTNQGIHAGACYASCCTRPFYSWVTHHNTYTSYRNRFIPDGGAPEYYTMDEAKAACELETAVNCAGIQDEGCDGVDEEDEESHPLYLVAGSIDMTNLGTSNRGSCIVEMKLGDVTTATTTLADFDCTYEVIVAKTEDGIENSTWKTFKISGHGWDDRFRFTGCTPEGEGGEACVEQGVDAGVRILTGRDGVAARDGSCCTSVTNKVFSQRRLACNGYSNEYVKRESTYIAQNQLLPGEFATYDEAVKNCLRLTTDCWGIVDSACDNTGFMLADRNKVAAGEVLVSTAVPPTCTYEKMPYTR